MNTEKTSPCGSFLLLLLAALLKQGSAQVTADVDVRNIRPPRSFPLSLGPSRVVDETTRAWTRGLDAYLQELPHSSAGIAEEIRNNEREKTAQELPVMDSAIDAPEEAREGGTNGMVQQPVNAHAAVDTIVIAKKIKVMADEEDSLASDLGETSITGSPSTATDATARHLRSSVVQDELSLLLRCSYDVQLYTKLAVENKHLLHKMKEGANQGNHEVETAQAKPGSSNKAIVEGKEAEETKEEPKEETRKGPNEETSMETNVDKTEEQEEKAEPVKGKTGSSNKTIEDGNQAEETKEEPKEETRKGPNEETNVDKTEEQEEKVETVKGKTGSSNKTIEDGKEANETKKVKARCSSMRPANFTMETRPNSDDLGETQATVHTTGALVCSETATDMEGAHEACEQSNPAKCPANYVLRHYAAKLRCAGNICNQEDVHTCCVERATCATAQFQLENISHVCNVRSDTKREAKGACSETKAVCPTMHTPKTNSATLRCAGAACTASDVSTCCDKVCHDFVHECPDGMLDTTNASLSHFKVPSGCGMVHIWTRECTCPKKDSVGVGSPTCNYTDPKTLKPSLAGIMSSFCSGLVPPGEGCADAVAKIGKAYMNDYLPPRAAAMKAFISPASSNVSINETYRTLWAGLWRNEHKDKTIQNMWDQADKHEVVKGASGSVVLCTDDDKFMKPATRHTCKDILGSFSIRHGSSMCPQIAKHPKLKARCGCSCPLAGSLGGNSLPEMPSQERKQCTNDQKDATETPFTDVRGRLTCLGMHSVARARNPGNKTQILPYMNVCNHPTHAALAQKLCPVSCGVCFEPGDMSVARAATYWREGNTKRQGPLSSPTQYNAWLGDRLNGYPYQKMWPNTTGWQGYYEDGLGLPMDTCSGSASPKPVPQKFFINSTKWNTPAAPVDAFNKTRLIEVLEEAFNKIGLPGKQGCQVTLGSRVSGPLQMTFSPDPRLVFTAYLGGTGNLNICDRSNDARAVLFDEDAAAGSVCRWPKDGMPKGSHLVLVRPCWATTPICAVVKVAVTKSTNKVQVFGFGEAWSPGLPFEQCVVAAGPVCYQPTQNDLAVARQRCSKVHRFNCSIANSAFLQSLESRKLFAGYTRTFRSCADVCYNNLQEYLRSFHIHGIRRPSFSKFVYDKAKMTVTILENADATIREAVAQLRFEVTQQLQDGSTPKALSLPGRCPCAQDIQVIKVVVPKPKGLPKKIPPVGSKAKLPFDIAATPETRLHPHRACSVSFARGLGLRMNDVITAVQGKPLADLMNASCSTYFSERKWMGLYESTGSAELTFEVKRFPLGFLSHCDAHN